VSTSGLTKKLFEECALSEKKLAAFEDICLSNSPGFHWLLPSKVGLDYCWHVAIVEKRLPRHFGKDEEGNRTVKHTTVDLFGGFDLVAVRVGCLGVTAIQATSITNMSARARKILDLKICKPWLLAGNRIVIIGFETGAKRIKLREIKLTDLKKASENL
jgi:hypothetical protein